MAKKISSPSSGTPIDEIKELLAESRYRIKLYDYIKEKSDSLIANTSEEIFPVNTPWDNNEFVSRLKRYEEASSDLISIMALVGHWGTLDHLSAVSISPRHFALQLGKDSRTNNWTCLRWYPLMLIAYAIGIGAIAADNYAILYSFFRSTCGTLPHVRHSIPLTFTLEESFGAARDLFRNVPGHESKRYPACEYLFGFFNNRLKSVVFLGEDYEDIFDRFEILYALQHAHEREEISTGHIWGPIGRFGWKFRNGNHSSPYKHLVDEAAHSKEMWKPLRAGFFDGSYERFESLAHQYEQRLQKIY